MSMPERISPEEFSDDDDAVFERLIAHLPPNLQELARRDPKRQRKSEGELAANDSAIAENVVPQMSEETRIINDRRKRAAELRAQQNQRPVLDEDVKDQLIKDFPNDTEVKEIIAERRAAGGLPRDRELGDISASFDDPKLRFELGADFDENNKIREGAESDGKEHTAEKEEVSKKESTGIFASGSYGEKAMRAYERLTQPAREAASRLYEGVKIDYVDRTKFWVNDKIFRAVTVLFGNPEAHAQRRREAIVAEESAIASRRASREKFFSQGTDGVQKELAEKMAGEDAAALERIERLREEEGRALKIHSRLEARRLDFEAARAEKAGALVERIDDQLEILKKQAEPYEAQIAEHEKLISEHRNTVQMYEEQFADVQKMHSEAGSRHEARAFRQHVIEIKKALAEEKKKLVASELVIDGVRGRHGTIQKKINAWEARKARYEALIIPAEEKAGLSQSVAEPADKKEINPKRKTLEEYAEAKNLYIEEEAEQAEKTAASFSGLSQAEKAQWIERVKVRAGLDYDRIIAEDMLPHVFEEVSDLPSLFDAVNQSANLVDRIGSLVGEQTKKLATDIINGHAPLEQAPEIYGFRKAVERLRDKAELARKGIPEGLAWAPENVLEKNMITPERFAEIWNQYASEKYMLPPGAFRRMFEKGVDEVPLSEIEAECLNYFRKLYEYSHGVSGIRRFDGTYIAGVQETLKKIKPIITASLNYS